MNLTVLIGRLGRPPERRETRAGSCVCNLRIATSFKPKDGEERADWHDVVVWGEAAKACAEHLSTGQMVAVSGRLQTRSWEAENGDKRWRTEVVAHRVDFLSGRGGEGPSDKAASPTDGLPF